ncbi:glycosyltransferase family 2 protein [Phascolarctobacterium sp.]|uniref:glycosyltransferase family 2 protein n=1 Tax=Phascolarctobacterium sp. TaxID=2049039 RepID=UPI003862E3B7
MISCIIPVYNCETYLNACIDSVLNQTYNDFEVILVDDGSTDKSGVICDQYAALDNRVRVFHKENGGVSSARNFGINKAYGEHIIFIDGDDRITEDLFQVLDEDLKHYNADIAICGWKHCDPESEIFLEGHERSDNVKVIDNPVESYYSEKYTSQLINKLIKKEIIDDNNIRFAENIHYSEDLLFVAVLLANCKRVTYREDVLYYYIQHKDSLSWRKGDFDFWNGYVTAKEIVLNKFKEYGFSKNLIRGAYRGYCVALIALYRFVVHDRNKIAYDELTQKHRSELLSWIWKSDISLGRKMEYLSFVWSYAVATAFHKRH